MADKRNLQRGWGLCCSKSCAANKRERSRQSYSPIRVAKNDIRRITWNSMSEAYARSNKSSYDDVDESHPLEWDHGDFK